VADLGVEFDRAGNRRLADAAAPADGGLVAAGFDPPEQPVSAMAARATASYASSADSAPSCCGYRSAPSSTSGAFLAGTGR
jgi:hypothetical protein